MKTYNNYRLYLQRIVSFCAQSEHYWPLVFVVYCMTAIFCWMTPPYQAFLPLAVQSSVPAVINLVK